MKTLPPAGYYAYFLSLLLLVTGIWGLRSNVVFDAITTNRTHALIQLALAIAGLLTYRTHARAYSVGVGLLLLSVGVLRFVPATLSQVTELVNVNGTGAVASMFIGLLGIYYGTLAHVRYAHHHKALT